MFSILRTIGGILGYIIPILITLGVIYFIFGVVQYVISADEEVKKTAKSRIIQGLIGIFIITSFWGVLSVVENTFSVGGGKINSVPCIPNPNAYPPVYC